MLQATHVYESCLYVDDLTAAREFYHRVLGLELVSEMGDRGLAFRCGSGMVLLFDPHVSRLPDDAIPSHGGIGAGHLAFAVAATDLPQWREHLAREGVPIETEIIWRPGVTSVYFRDPAGNSLELASPQLWEALRQGKVEQSND